jgi:hypothetical protein
MTLDTHHPTSLAADLASPCPASPDEVAKALRRSVRTRGIALIEALHELDGSRRGAGFRSARLGRARDLIEEAVSEIMPA